MAVTLSPPARSALAYIVESLRGPDTNPGLGLFSRLPQVERRHELRVELRRFLLDALHLPDEPGVFAEWSRDMTPAQVADELERGALTNPETRTA